MHHVQHWWGKERQLESIHRYTGQIEIEIWLPATTCHNVAQRGRDELNPASKAWPFSSSHSLDQFEVSKKKKKSRRIPYRRVPAEPPFHRSPCWRLVYVPGNISSLRKFRLASKEDSPWVFQGLQSGVWNHDPPLMAVPYGLLLRFKLNETRLGVLPKKKQKKTSATRLLSALKGFKPPNETSCVLCMYAKSSYTLVPSFLPQVFSATALTICWVPWLVNRS